MFDIQKLQDFPQEPGVYLMKNSAGEVLYVGKAKNLRQRIRQYFLPGRDSREMIPYLTSKVHTVQTIVVLSEKEALLLENNLIKQYTPRYNALLKDDKTYLALKVSTKSPWPKVELVRYRGQPKPDGLYFGPYTGAHSARQMLDLLQKIFPLRQCSDQEFAKRTRPCILYDMRRCLAPCVGKCTKEEYDDHVKHLIQFLRGQNRQILEDLHREMEKASEQLEFEKAGALLRTIRDIERTLETQHVDKVLGIDMDVFGLYRQGDEASIALLIFRSGKLLETRHYNFSRCLEENKELLSSLLLQRYSPLPLLPHEILLPALLEEHEALEEVLSEGKKRHASILAPQKGDKLRLIEMAHANAKAHFQQSKDEQQLIEKTLIEMQEHLHLVHFPRRIECLDISNLGGSEPVGAIVAFVDGKKETSRYRKYKIATADASDDYGAMQEVLLRRFKKAEEEKDLPDLLIIDGGKGHLNAALKIFEELNIVSVDVISLAKEQGRHDKGMTLEQVFLPEIKEPLLLKRHSSVLFFLQRVRDEAHRFVITFQKKRRAQFVRKSLLDEITGIGPVKKQSLLRHFGSLKNVEAASLEALQKAPKITEADAKKIRIYFDSKKTP